MANNTDMVPVPPAPEISLGALRASTPGQLVQGATRAANELAAVIDSRNLFKSIQGRRHVLVEGWLTLATMMGCLPLETSNERQDDGTYIAVVELRRMSDGAVMSRASAECGGPDEGMWQGRPPYARRSMASTRATSKACRTAFAWVVALAGYATTPAEEMDGVCGPERPPERPLAQQPVPATGTISDAQRRRMWGIAKGAGVSQDTVREIVASHGYESTGEISRRDYDPIITAIQEWASAEERAPEPTTIDQHPSLDLPAEEAEEASHQAHADVESEIVGPVIDPMGQTIDHDTPF